MTIDEFYTRLMSITGNKERHVEERIDAALELLQQAKPEDEVTAARFESITYGVITSMLDKENSGHAYDVEMLQALTLSAESMIRGQLERSLKDFRKGVYPLIDGGRVPFATLTIAVSRIVEALRSTVFNHDRYGILDAFIRHAAKVADAGEEYDREAVADLLARKYRILWRNPHEMNPNVVFD